jgi:O-acetyl-ADP-ribose deacetylase (regulator of RNase III)
MEETRRLWPAGCPTGQARITGGHRLPARFVIHTVGPVWQGGRKGEAELLAACYSGSLALAAESGAVTIAFPAISAGVYAYPLEEAAQVALRSLAEGLERHPALTEARMVLFNEQVFSAFQRALAALRGS